MTPDPFELRNRQLEAVRARVRLLAVGGMVGPVAFVATWAIAGSATSRYSAVDDAISDLASTTAPTQVEMTLAFIAFGMGVIAFGLALRACGAGPAWIAAVATACCTLGVAATPLGDSARDVVHGAFASLGYLTLAAVPLLGAATLARAGRDGWARVSRACALLAGLALLASAFGPAHGFWQRAGLTLGDLWLVVVAGHLVAGRNLFAPRPLSQ